MNSSPNYSFSRIVRHLTLLLLLVSPNLFAQTAEKTFATIETSMGTIKLELFNNKTPATVDNFVHYAESGFYNNTLFHRVIPNFMIQAGGFDTEMIKKATGKPIKNEANPFIPNRRGTIAMARTSDPHSATSQFFINVKDNNSLNNNKSNPGYAVFGKVVQGMIVADQISNVKTAYKNRMGDVPVNPVIIKTITISKQADESLKK